jgi:predicted hotdog family 3-hydroxylacyl-ACP dehydratase
MMLISEENILEFIPQRQPMVMIDCLVECDERSAVSRLTIRQDNLFLGPKGFTASGIMETMAQTAAARIGYLQKSRPGGAGKKPPVGVIGSIKNFRLYFLPEIGTVLNTTIVIEHEVMQATVVRAKVEADGKLAAEGDLQIFITEEQA